MMCFGKVMKESFLFYNYHEFYVVCQNESFLTSAPSFVVSMPKIIKFFQLLARGFCNQDMSMYRLTKNAITKQKDHAN